jgi:hypothetical protein
MPRFLPVAALIISAAASLVAHAGEVKVFRNSESVDPTEVAHPGPLRPDQDALAALA